MNIFSDAFNIFINLDDEYLNIVSLSLQVSLAATVIASIFSIYLSSILAVKNFFGKSTTLIIINALMSLPPVVIGLILYILFSASGAFGFLEILYTPSIMIIAQVILITPIIISLAYKTLGNKYDYLREYLLSMDTPNRKAMYTIIIECRYDLLIIVIAGLGRALSEVGAVIIVGGNIANMTRVMTTSIVLETSRGELALALSLGFTLIVLAILINILIHLLKNKFL